MVVTSPFMLMISRMKRCCNHLLYNPSIAGQITGRSSTSSLVFSRHSSKFGSQDRDRRENPCSLLSFSKMANSVGGVARLSDDASSSWRDLSIPTDVWSASCRRAYDALSAEMAAAAADGADWEKKPYLVDMTDAADEPRLLTRVDREQTGRFFNYAFWVSCAESRLRGVIEFGPYVQGPPSCAHGGATATIADACMGSLIFHLGRRAVTANLNVNYRGLVQLGVPYTMEASLERTDGRKLFMTFRLSSADGTQLCVESTALFLTSHVHPRDMAAQQAASARDAKAVSADYVFPEKSGDPKL